jgi:hypothetical protein
MKPYLKIKPVLFFLLILLFNDSLNAQVMLPAYQGVISKKIAMSCSNTPATAATSAKAIKEACPTATDGIYWIRNVNINGGAAFQIYADMTTDGGGWMLLNASGGGIASTQVATLTSLESTGYLPRATVIALANISTIVQLRNGPLANKFANVSTSSDIKPITALRSTVNGTNGAGTWHSNSAFSSFQVNSGSWTWNNNNGVANGWPDMFHSSGNANGVHWLPTSPYATGRSWDTREYYSTWIK